MVQAPRWCWCCWSRTIQGGLCFPPCTSLYSPVSSCKILKTDTSDKVPVWIHGAEQCPPDSWARDYPGVGRYGWNRWGSEQSGYMGVLMSPELTFRAMSSLWFCMLLNPLSLMSFILICGKINAWKVLKKPSNCPYLPPGDTWYWFSLWKWFTGLLKPGKDQMLWASWSHFPSLLSANTRGDNWEIIDQRSFFFGMLTHRPKV